MFVITLILIVVIVGSVCVLKTIITTFHDEPPYVKYQLHVNLKRSFKAYHNNPKHIIRQQGVQQKQQKLEQRVLIEKDSEIDDYVIEENIEKNKDYIWNGEYEDSLINNNNTMNNSLHSLNLMFFVWFPYYNNYYYNNQTDEEDLFWESLHEYNNTIRQSIMKSLVQLICDETDFVIVDGSYSILNNVTTTTTLETHNNNLLNEYNMYNVCRNNKPSSFGNEQQNEIKTLTTFNNNKISHHLVTAIWNHPRIIIKRQSRTEHINILDRNHNNNTSNNDTYHSNGSRTTLTWTNWIMSYPILHIGDKYIEEMINNQPNSMISNDIVLRESTLKMNEIIQINLDVSLMNNKLDIILNDNILQTQQTNSKNNNTTTQSQTEEEYNESIIMINNNNINALLFAYTSPIEMEWDLFYPTYENAFFNTSTASTSSCNGTTTTTALPPYDPLPFTPLRITGITLMMFTFLYTGLLTYFSIRRRNMISEDNKKGCEGELKSRRTYNKKVPSVKIQNDRLSTIISNTEDTSSGWLSSHDSLNEMLHLSSCTIFRSSITNIPTTTTTTKNIDTNYVKKQLSMNDTMMTDDETILIEETTVHTKMINTDCDNSCNDCGIENVDDPKIVSLSLKFSPSDDDNSNDNDECCHCLDDDDDDNDNDIGPLSDILKATRKEANNDAALRNH